MIERATFVGSIQGKSLVLGHLLTPFMYLLYLDESGDTGNWQDQNCFVIAGVGIYEFRVNALKDRVREVQNTYFPNIKIPISFHATDIHSGSGMYRKMSFDTREQLLQDLYEAIGENRPPNVMIFGAVMSIDSATNPYQDRSQVFERLFALSMNSSKKEKSSSKHEENRERAIRG